jgi:hypothetical protein
MPRRHRRKRVEILDSASPRVRWREPRSFRRPAAGECPEGQSKSPQVHLWEALYSNTVLNQPGHFKLLVVF